MIQIGISVSIGLLLFCFIMLLCGKKASAVDRVDRRLLELEKEVDRAYLTVDEELNKPLSERLIRPILRKLISILSALLPVRSPKNAAGEKQQKMLRQAGWTISLEEYLVLQLILMATFGMAGLLIAYFSEADILHMGMYFLGGVFGIYAILRYTCAAAGTKRKTAVEKQLPDMLDLLSVSVAAGLGFERAMLHIIETMDGPLIDEFSVAYREMSMGRSRKDAMTLLGERCGVEDLSSVTGAIVQAGQLGIPIGNVLQSQAAAIRRTRRNKVEEKAAKVSTKILLPMIGFIFPVLIIVLLGPSLITISQTFG